MGLRRSARLTATHARPPRFHDLGDAVKATWGLSELSLYQPVLEVLACGPLAAFAGPREDGGHVWGF